MSRIVRVYPRMVMGGAEQHVLQLLRGIPGTELVIPGMDGEAGRLARPLAARTTVVERPRLAGTVRALRGARIVHMHTINNDPVLGLAVQLSGAERLVQTVHNNTESDYNLFMDHTFVVGVETREMLPAPGRVSTLTEGVEVPAEVPRHPPLKGRPIRILEVRRPDKPMAFTLEEVLASGGLEGLRVEARVVGISGPSAVPGLQNLGGLSDPSPHFAWADLVLHGTAIETFGRTVYEALAGGALPVATPIPAFTERLVDGEQVVLAGGLRCEDGVAAIWRAVELLQNPERVVARREANHRWVTERASTPVMVRSQQAGYAAVLEAAAAPRSVWADDVPDAHLDAFGRIIDTIHYGGGARPEEVDALPLRARGLVFWSLAQRKRGPARRRHQLYLGALKMLGPRPSLLRDLGEFHAERGEWGPAKGYFLKALQAEPQVVPHYLELAHILLREKQYPAARQVFLSLQKAVPAYAQVEEYLQRLDGASQPRGPRPFTRFRRYKRVIVTGPHRSGTTVATEMIAADSGMEPVREEAFEFYNEALLREVLQREGVVVQCPALFDLMPVLSDPHTAVVLMRRPLGELSQSRARMFDPATAHQLSGEEQNDAQLERLGQSDGDAAALKYDLWDRWVAERRIHNPVELAYARLAEHPMWVSPEDRRKLGRRWHNRRTRL